MYETFPPPKSIALRYSHRSHSSLIPLPPSKEERFKKIVLNNEYPSEQHIYVGFRPGPSSYQTQTCMPRER